jgi:pimeloyl-ACP methyl ester carboxylesterase
MSVYKIVIRVFTTILLAAFATGCAFCRLKSEVDGLQKQRVLYGEVAYEAEEEGGLLAVVYTKRGRKQKPVAFREIPWKSKRFVFLLEPGDYRLMIAHDRNHNLVIDSGEPRHVANHGEQLRFSDISTRVDLFEQMSAEHTEGLREFEPDLRGLADREERYRVAVGDIAKPSHPRFSSEAGGMGLWRPHRFLKKYGMGIYMMSPYDEEKIPVLFVSGAGGHLENWSYFMSELDKTRYQAWYYSYPSGIRIGRSGEVLHTLAKAMKEIYGFDKMVVVAHSMGGLVARELVVRQIADPEERIVDRLVTIATPWGGHDLAKSGVDHLTTSITSPVPAWRDVAQGSPFLQELFSRKLSPHVEHHLIYTHVEGRDSDGTISLKSQRLFEAESDASDVKGFQYNHVEVLSQPAVFRHVEKRLARTGAPPLSAVPASKTVIVASAR